MEIALAEKSVTKGVGQNSANRTIYVNYRNLNLTAHWKCIHIYMPTEIPGKK